MTRPIITPAVLAEILPRIHEVTPADRKLGKEAAFILACDGTDGEIVAVDLARDLRIFLDILERGPRRSATVTPLREGRGR